MVDKNKLEEKYLKQLEQICEHYDYDPYKILTKHLDMEGIHRDSDWVLVKCLRELGFNKLADLYETMEDEFWYA